MKVSKRSASTANVAVTASKSGHWPFAKEVALIFIVTLIAYWPALKGGFLWDDMGHVTNPVLQSWAGLMRIWFEPGATQQYYPILHSAFWIEHGLWGDAPLGYHLINVLWHVTSAGLLVVILRRLVIPGALVAGLVFALHPVCVESVAWISEQKNTLSTVFYLAAVLAWLRFEGDRRPKNYAIATLWFVAALLTKTVTATLPAALLVLAWWRRGRISWRSDVRWLLPWLALGGLGGLGTAWFEHTQIGATGAEFTLSGLERGLLAGRVVWFYLGKLLWPVGLTFFYPRWTIDSGIVWQWLFPIAVVILLAILFCLRQRTRAPLAVALLFGGALFPVLGFVNVFPFIFSYVADHFQYLASLAVIAFLVAAAARGFERLAWPSARGVAVATVVILILGVLTWRQSGMYRDVFVLYETTLARNPSSWVAELNLGVALDNAGQTEASLPHLQRSLRLKPGHPETLNSLGNVLNRLGRASEALPLLEQAVQIQPRFADAYNAMGAASMALGRRESGIAAFKRALEINPKLAQAEANLGWALVNENHPEEALAHFERAEKLQPDSGAIEFKWGVALAMQGRMADAVMHFSRSIELEPEQAETRFALGQALLETGRREEAIEQLEQTLNLDPSHAGAHETLSHLQPPSSPRR